MMKRYLLRTLKNQLRNLSKLAINGIWINVSNILNDFTYLFDVGSFRGFISLLLKAANHDSHGEAEYEWGPVNSTGTLRAYNRSIVGLLL